MEEEMEEEEDLEEDKAESRMGNFLMVAKASLETTIRSSAKRVVKAIEDGEEVGR